MIVNALFLGQSGELNHSTNDVERVVEEEREKNRGEKKEYLEKGGGGVLTLPLAQENLEKWPKPLQTLRQTEVSAVSRRVLGVHLPTGAVGKHGIIARNSQLSPGA